MKDFEWNEYHNWALVILGVFSLTCLITYKFHETEQMRLKNGYCEYPQMGSSISLWQKCK
jgi:hypothetical protein